jgi:hypothetical protein
LEVAKAIGEKKKFLKQKDRILQGIGKKAPWPPKALKLMQL